MPGNYPQDAMKVPAQGDNMVAPAYFLWLIGHDNDPVTLLKIANCTFQSDSDPVSESTSCIFIYRSPPTVRISWI